MGVWHPVGAEVFDEDGTTDPLSAAGEELHVGGAAMTVARVQPVRKPRARHGEEVRNARRERRRVAAAALLSLGYSAAKIAEQGLS